MTNWSAQQSLIFSWFREGKGNLVVRARAGTGKTTTIIEGMSHAREDRILLAAFNKKIAVELDERLVNPGAEAKTLHSLGYGFVRQYWNGVGLDSRGDRSRSIAMLAAKGAPDDLLRDITKLSAILKAVEPFIGNSEEVSEEELCRAMDLASGFDISLDEDWAEQGFDDEWLAKTAIETLRIGCEHRDATIDFDDMVWLPVRNRWARPIYDLTVIDEAQDMNKAQINLAIMVTKKSGRVAVVGDDRQAIYGFRGADSGSIDRLKKALKAKELGLTTTYRCGKRIVAEAQRLVPDFVAFEKNPQGVVARANIGKMMEEAHPGDFILSRTNAPLVSICLKLLRDGKRANIEGKDVGRGLKAIAKKHSVGPARNSMEKFIERLERWLDAELDKARARGERGLSAISRLNDQFETILALLDGLASPSELTGRIDALFEDTKENKGRKIILSSVHKSKGLEADRVWLLRDTFFSLMKEPPAWASGAEEKNIEYVAITRAKSQLTWIEGKL